MRTFFYLVVKNFTN